MSKKISCGGFEFDEKSFAQDGRVLSTVVSQADDIELSEATDVAGIVEDFNDLVLALKNSGVITPDKFDITVTKNVVDSISGRADRQYNTNQIKSVSEEDGVITIVLKKAVSELKDFNAGGKWGVHKWLGIGISAGVTPITNLKYNGSSLTSEDIYEATQVGLDSGYFVRWVAADLVLTENNNEASKNYFTLWANGYGSVKYTIKLVEG